MKTNTPNRYAEKTHEGAPAARMTAEQALRRSVLSCLLWEREAYEDGQDIAARIEALADNVEGPTVAALAIEAREVMNLRHVPLLLLLALGKAGGPLVADTIERVLKRADEPAELLALYWRNGKRPLSAQLKKGLARAMLKFDAYQLAKYDRPGAVRLRDVLFITHAKPADEAQAETWRQLVAGTLPAPDTWEVALSAGADKRETFERLLREGNLGYLALLRNLRNMAEAGVNPDLVRQAIRFRGNGADRVLPFRYVAAARAAPQFEPDLDAALVASLDEMTPLPGKTVILVDVSDSMNQPLSAKSDLTRMDAAATLASVFPAEPGAVRVFSFSNDLKEVPPRRGMAGVDAIRRSQFHQGTHLFAAVERINATVPYDRLVVITDEQAAAGGYSGGLGRMAPGRLEAAKGRAAYMVNVASAKNGVAYGVPGWTQVNGFSEGVLRYMAEVEREGAPAPSADRSYRGELVVTRRDGSESRIPYRPGERDEVVGVLKLDPDVKAIIEGDPRPD